MLANYLIGLREGLEAALVVSILVAYLVKTDRRHLLPRVWAGVVIAILMSVGLTLGLGLQSRQLTFRTQELVGGVLSIVAAAFVTWMIFWMAGAARSIAGDLRGRVDAAAESRWSLVVVAFLAVGREGLETALILWTATRTATGRDLPDTAPVTWEPLLAAVLGIATAVVLGHLIYRGAVSINLTRFFAWTGALLVFVAAGVLSYGMHDLQEAGVLPGLDHVMFDVTHILPPDSLVATLLKGFFNFSPQTTWVEGLVWLAYVAVVLPLFLLKIRRRTTPTAAPEPEGIPA
ncbi:high-affinity iron transporter [Nocardioides alpinus]|uniref:High-affinity Fe2+/Pb2+ permease n=1 Tax=Nocardioides alpinus TaxID=748909 RepID=A0A1I0XHG1_9ACTN|nr:iron uptake transporter permease EfeU [Nocardioides alpinus]PKH44305.1 high-affinity Fe2+/Pb2+ permease [Nocardioides alpinus]SFA99393.1 high-affinity iron transporter [Nocardioides alpinus]